MDCHPNGTLSTVQVNPYTTGRTSNTNSNGDPMDLSWAVDENGTPVELDSVRYVRVYTGVMQMNGMMGESSTEVLGSHRATLKGTGKGAVPTIAVNGTNVVLSDGDHANTCDYTVSGDQATISVSGGTYVYINGVASTSTTVDVSDGEAHLVQVISQTGTASPYIVVLNLQKG